MLEPQFDLILKCMVTTVYLYSVITLIDTALVEIVAAAVRVPPTNWFSLAFNMWFGVMMLSVLGMMRPLIGGLLFPAFLDQPSASTDILVGKDGISGIRVVNNNGESDATTLVGYLLSRVLPRKQDCASSDVPAESNTSSANVQSPPKSPGSSEHSCAETVAGSKQTGTGIVGDELNTVN